MNTILIEFVGELYIAMKNNLDQYDNTVGLEFDLDLLVAELAARGTCQGNSQLVELKYLNVY